MLCIQNNIVTFFVSIVLLTATTAYAAETVDVTKLRLGAGSTGTGKNKSELCQGCHGANGISVDDMIPNLAGQYARYITKELRDFQSGARTHQIMSALALTINDTELIDISAFFANQEMMRGNALEESPVGKNIFLKGDSSRGIPACKNCHGLKGKGFGPDVTTFPVIGGQRRGYLRAQLVNWRSGDRSNSPNGMMNQFAKPLTDEEIEALVDYISGL
jgi:cytochrome c553